MKVKSISERRGGRAREVGRNFSAEDKNGNQVTAKRRGKRDWIDPKRMYIYTWSAGGGGAGGYLSLFLEIK